MVTTIRGIKMTGKSYRDISQEELAELVDSLYSYQTIPHSSTYLKLEEGFGDLNHRF
jgi:hypothetical protein